MDHDIDGISSVAKHPLPFSPPLISTNLNLEIHTNGPNPNLLLIIDLLAN